MHGSRSILQALCTTTLLDLGNHSTIPSLSSDCHAFKCLAAQTHVLGVALMFSTFQIEGI